MVLKRINRRGIGELASVSDDGPVGVGVNGFVANGNDSFVGGLSLRLGNNDDLSIIDTQSCWDGQSYYGGTTQTFAGGGMSVVSNDSSSMYTKATTANEGMTKMKNTICPEQSKVIYKTRIIVFIVLLVSSITVCTLSYTLMTKILQQQQNNDTPYHQQYEWTAKQILEEFQSTLPLQIVPIIETLQDVVVAPADETLQVDNTSVSTNIFVATATIQNTTSTNTNSFVRSVNDSNVLSQQQQQQQQQQQTVTWPTTTMMNKFPYRTNTIRTMSPLGNTILSIAVYPVVDHSIQDVWNDYAATKKSIWINASLHFQISRGINTSITYDDNDLNLHATSDNSVNAVSNINDPSLNDTTHTSNYTTPLWQISPYTPAIRNYVAIEANSTTQSSLSEMLIPQKLLKFCADNSKIIIGNFVNSVDDASKQYLKTLQSTQNQYQHIDIVESFEDDPYSQIAIPFHSIVGTDDGVDNTTKTQPVVTIVAAMLRWKKYLERISISKIVPDSGVYELILSSSCGGSDNSTSIYYTFRANGRNVHFVGLGDLHDSQWDQYKRQIPNQLDMFNSICSITLTVYPTDEVFANIVTTTNGSNLYAIFVLVVAICMFLCIGIVFKVYDLHIERRHDIVLHRAALSTTLVKSLFPGEIATRVMNHQTRDNNTASKGDQVSNNNNNNKNPSPRKVSASHNLNNNLMNQASDGTTNIRQSTKLPKFPLFGNNVRIEQAEALVDDDTPSTPSQPKSSTTRALSKRLIRTGHSSDDDDDQSVSSNEPIADLFPNTTVFFADIAGFTAWSSTRDPAAVFKLLQGVYQAFDKIAKRLKVFKVETIGDSYVAVTGLPQPQENHAVIMARFAYACKAKMTEVTSRLELQLGPGTSDLVLRTGLHSGPVTGGVLMGDKARFQLFGDTVNTASRMESTGIKEKIQLSTSTATLLIEAGKGHWVVPRADKVTAKGKGEMQTYWLEMDNASRKRGNKRTSSNLSSTSNSDASGNKNIDGVKDQNTEVEHVDGIETGDAADDEDDLNQICHSKIEGLGNRVPMKMLTKNEKLVSWICELLRGQIQKVAVTRIMNHLVDNGCLIPPDAVSTLRVINPTTPPIDEVVDYLDVPEYSVVPKTRRELAVYQVDTKATQQLHQLVTQIASSYNDNAFHNFEHACYVVMSVSKLLRRINPSAAVASKNSTDTCSEHSPSRKAGYTYGVHSDAITQLALLFAALVHDIDHRGVSNKPLMIEEPQLALTYKNTSVAEQNSIDIAWTTFMSDSYEHLRSVIFQNNEELWRFRRIVVNAVLATDILDPHSNETRENRWKKMFQKTKQQQKDSTTTNPAVYKKPYQAAIVVEYMMQASDVSHTMQHWLVYIKWNTNLLREVYTAYTNHRLAVNPIEYWYQSELDFFDHYVIPLAQKLKSSHAFGSSITEYVTYAKKNRAEWAVHGQDIINETIRSISVNSINTTGSQTDEVE